MILLKNYGKYLTGFKNLSGLNVEIVNNTNSNLGKRK